MINKVILVGNVGQDPDIKRFEGGNKVAKFSMATSEKYKKDNEIVDKTEWHNIISWGKLAEIVENLIKKGSLVYVEGKLTSRSYEKKDGSKAFVTEVVIHTMKLLDRGKGKDEEPKKPLYTSPGFNSSSGEIPF